MDLSKKILDSLTEFTRKLERGEEVEMTRVEGVTTPDGPLHIRKKVRMNENKEAKRCIVYPYRIVMSHFGDMPLVLAKVGDHQIVTGDHYDEGTLGVFIPDGAIIPDKLADEMRVLGKLAGKKKNRVKARTLFGYESEGLFYGSRFYDVIGDNNQKVFGVGPSWNPDWIEGQDVTEELGVTFKE